MANHSSSSSSFHNQIIYPTLNTTEYSFWSQLYGEFLSSYATNNDGASLHTHFDPIWNFEHNLEGLIGANARDPLAMNGALTASNAIPIEEDITQAPKVAAVREDSTAVAEGSMIETIISRKWRKTKRTFHDPSTISREMLSNYFHMSVYQAAKELRVGYTILKRRCEELGIFRWPHRQLVSLERLSENVQEFGSIEDDPEVQEVVKELKDGRAMMLRDPNLKLTVAEIRLRDACTRKKRYREMTSLPTHPFSCSSTCCQSYSSFYR